MISTPPVALLLSDVDGTIVSPDKVLTPAAIAAARSLHLSGIGLALTSARPPHGMRMLIEPLRLQLPLCGFNGGLIVDPHFNVIERHPIDAEVADQVVRLVQECGLDLWVYTEQDWVVSDSNGAHVAREAWILAMVPQARPITAADTAQAYKIVGVSDDPAKVEAARQRVVQRLGGVVSATSSAPYFIDITHPQANKGAVVHALANRLGILPADIATIGDMPNDVLMFAQSGLSIAMGNASPDVQARASVVTATNAHDGFASAVHRFILPHAAAAAPDRQRGHQ